MSDHRDMEKWSRMEKLLDRYNIKPILGIIPDNQDPALLAYPQDGNFWAAVRAMLDKGWVPALHGCNHVFHTKQGGLNPVNAFSEFAGVSLERQKAMLREGYALLQAQSVEPKIFFAPAHTYDENTLTALREETPIRIISDTVAANVYFRDGFYYIPQQTGKARKLPLPVVTFCYHPNIMQDADFAHLEDFLKKNSSRFVCAENIPMPKRQRGLLDMALHALYFGLRKLRRALHGWR